MAETNPFQLRIVSRTIGGKAVGLYIIIRDSEGNASKKIRPNITTEDESEDEIVTNFDFGPEIGVKPPFAMVEIWRDDYKAMLATHLPMLNECINGEGLDDAIHWYLDRIEVSVKSETEENWVFPVHREISKDLHYFIYLYDCLLPQNDKTRNEFRQGELEKKRKIYAYAPQFKLNENERAPVMSRGLPKTETFSSNIYWKFVEKKFSLLASKAVIDWTTCKATSCEGYADIFKLKFNRPKTVDVWEEDWWFALQRLQGVVPNLIQLLKAVPGNLIVPDCITNFLEGKTFGGAVKKNKIFICDLTILKGLECPKGREVAFPIAVFYLNDDSKLEPIMIQLRVGDSSERNPIYTPNDSPNTWLAAKMYYNNAEAQFHEAVSHLALTHFMIDGICVAVHRSFSVSHPLYRLLAPHFLFTIAINKRGEQKLINEGGWIDVTMTQGVQGLFQLIAKGFGNWNFKEANPIYQIRKRGVLDPKVLPYYPYRDDAISLHGVIKKYVSRIVTNYYDSVRAVKADNELKQFWKELTFAPPDGLGLQGIPGSLEEGGFLTPGDVIETMLGIITSSTLAHAAVNWQQYEQYAFVPNYPPMLSKPPPTEKLFYSEEELVELLPSKQIALNSIVITNLLSYPMTKSLGDFEVQYLFHPEDIKALKRFRKELEELSLEIKKRNETRRWPYNDLDPANVPNSISI